ncbi:hypothetical protein Q7P37_007162 [Cladosporium fusiforme]
MADSQPDQRGNAYADVSAGGQARQHNGNVINNYNYNYTLRQRKSDSTLGEDQRNSLLLKAAAQGQLPRVRYLIRLGVNIDFSDDQGFTALHHAVLSGFEDCVQELIDAGIDVDAPSFSSESPLNVAAQKKRLNVVKLLLDARANVEQALGREGISRSERRFLFSCLDTMHSISERESHKHIARTRALPVRPKTTHVELYGNLGTDTHAASNSDPKSLRTNYRNSRAAPDPTADFQDCEDSDNYFLGASRTDRVSHPSNNMRQRGLGLHISSAQLHDAGLTSSQEDPPIREEGLSDERPQIERYRHIARTREQPTSTREVQDPVMDPLKVPLSPRLEAPRRVEDQPRRSWWQKLLIRVREIEPYDGELPSKNISQLENNNDKSYGPNLRISVNFKNPWPNHWAGSVRDYDARATNASIVEFSVYDALKADRLDQGLIGTTGSAIRVGKVLKRGVGSKRTTKGLKYNDEHVGGVTFTLTRFDGCSTACEILCCGERSRSDGQKCANVDSTATYPSDRHTHEHFAKPTSCLRKITGGILHKRLGMRPQAVLAAAGEQGCHSTVQLFGAAKDNELSFREATKMREPSVPG